MSWLIFLTWLAWFAEFNQTSAKSFSLGLGFTAPIASNMHGHRLIQSILSSYASRFQDQHPSKVLYFWLLHLMHS